MALISRMSAAVFMGPEMALHPEWQKLTTTYTVNVFTAASALRLWPSFLRPLVHQFLPQSKKCRDQVAAMRRLMRDVLDSRAQEKSVAIADGDAPVKHQDTITWMEEAAGGRPADHAAVQLAFAISALHTTSEAFRQILLDICMHPELLPALRTEVKNAITEHGWTTAGLFNMQLLDSVMKESQRMKAPPGQSSLRRHAFPH